MKDRTDGAATVEDSLWLRKVVSVGASGGCQLEMSKGDSDAKRTASSFTFAYEQK